MLPRLLLFTFPTFFYGVMFLLLFGLYRQRQRFDGWALAFAASAFLIASIIGANEHAVFFDEDIYIHIASNLAHTPIARLTLFGGPQNVFDATYYKQLPGFPVLLSSVFVVFGTSEAVAFIIARVFYGLSVGAVYLLGRELLATRSQATTAALAFATVPVCVAYSSSVGTDIPAALFATLGFWGMVSNNAALATSGFAMAAGVRLEMFALAPVLLVSNRISKRWKAGFVALLIPIVLHLVWVSTIAPDLARTERVNAAFSPSYLFANLPGNLEYLFNPFVFPIGAMILAMAAISNKTTWRSSVLAWLGAVSAVYLVFYAGSFQANPRYSIQITIPILLFAASWTPRKLALGLMIPTLTLIGGHAFELTGKARAAATDHQIAVQFAQSMEPDDLVIADEPEVFINYGRTAMNTLFALDRPEQIPLQFGRFRSIFYYSGVRSVIEGSDQWKASRTLKSGFELRLVRSEEFEGGPVRIFELVQKLPAAQ